MKHTFSKLEVLWTDKQVSFNYTHKHIRIWFLWRNIHIFFQKLSYEAGAKFIISLKQGKLNMIYINCENIDLLGHAV